MRGNWAGGLLALSALAFSDVAQTQTPPAPAEPPTCTTTTVVVKRGDVVLSSNSTTKCEEPGGAKPSLDVGKVLNAPSGLLTAIGTGGEELTRKSARGDWKTVEPGASGVCHLFLMNEQGAGGYRARTTGCSPAMSQVKAWTFTDGGVDLHDAGGTVVTRLTGFKDRAVSTGFEGRSLVFER
jgi:hypothetical protein